MYIGTQVIAFNDNLYELIRTFRDQEGFPIDECKEYYNCDTILRKQGILYVCRLIPELTILEETHNGKVQLVEKVQEESTPPEEKCPTG